MAPSQIKAKFIRYFLFSLSLSVILVAPAAYPHERCIELADGASAIAELSSRPTATIDRWNGMGSTNPVVVLMDPIGLPSYDHRPEVMGFDNLAIAFGRDHLGSSSLIAAAKNKIAELEPVYEALRKTAFIPVPGGSRADMNKKMSELANTASKIQYYTTLMRVMSGTYLPFPGMEQKDLEAFKAQLRFPGDVLRECETRRDYFGSMGRRDEAWFYTQLLSYMIQKNPVEDSRRYDGIPVNTTPPKQVTPVQ